MAGHSHAKNVMYQKGKEDAKKGKVFNKLAREITVAAKLGLPDPASNPRLRAAIADARKSNMPRDRIERAIKSAQPGADDGANYDEVRYEAYGPGGCALIIEALTENRNRTASELRTVLSKLGGTMGESGSVDSCSPRGRDFLSGKRGYGRCDAGSRHRGGRRECGIRCGSARNHDLGRRFRHGARRAGKKIRRGAGRETRLESANARFPLGRGGGKPYQAARCA